MYSKIFKTFLPSYAVVYILLTKTIIALQVQNTNYFQNPNFHQEPIQNFNAFQQHLNTPIQSQHHPPNSRFYQPNMPRNMNPNQINPVMHNNAGAVTAYNHRPGMNPQNNPSMLTPYVVSSSPPTTIPSGYIHLNPDKQSGQEMNIQGRNHDEHISALRKLTEDLRKEYLLKSINNPSAVDPAVLKRLDLATRPREARRGMVEDLNLNVIDSGLKPPVVPFETSPSDKSPVLETRSSSHSSQTFIGSQYQPEDSSKSNSTLSKGDNGVSPDMENGWIGLMTPTMSYTTNTSTVPSIKRKEYSAVRTNSKSKSSNNNQTKSQNSFSKKQLEIKRTSGNMNASKKLREVNARVRMNSKTLNTQQSFAHKLKKVLNSGKPKSRQAKLPKISINTQVIRPHSKVVSTKQSNNDNNADNSLVRNPSKVKPRSTFSAETFNPPQKAIRNKKLKYFNRNPSTSSTGQDQTNVTTVNDESIKTTSSTTPDSNNAPPSSSTIQEIPATAQSTASDTNSSPPSSSKVFQPSMINPYEPSDSTNEIIMGTKSQSLDSSGNSHHTLSSSMSYFPQANNNPTPLANTLKNEQVNTVDQSRNSLQTNFIPLTQPSLNPMFVALKETEQKNEILHFNPSTNMLTSTTAQTQLSPQLNHQQVFLDNIMSADQNMHPTYYQPHVYMQPTPYPPRFQNSWGFMGNHNPFGYYSHHGRPESGRMAPHRNFFGKINEIEDDSEEENNNKDPRDNLPVIVDPHHPIVQNALHPLGNPAKAPEQYVKKKTKVIDPSSLVPLNKTHVYIGLLLSWILVISAVCVYHVLHGKNLGKGAADEKIGQRPLLLNIPQDGSNPFFTGRALDLGSNWNFTKVLEYIDIAQKTYEGFDWYKLDCQKRALCELSQKDTWAGETGRKITNNYLLSIMDALDGIPIPRAIQAYLQSYKEAISQGKNSSKDCGAVYNQCHFSIKEVIASAGKPKKNTF